MTRDEMVEKYCKNTNYESIQEHIKEAMLNHEKHLYVHKEGYGVKPDYICLDSTRDRLIKDGFIVEDYPYDTYTWVIKW